MHYYVHIQIWDNPHIFRIQPIAPSSETDSVTGKENELATIPQNLNSIGDAAVWCIGIQKIQGQVVTILGRYGVQQRYNKIDAINSTTVVAVLFATIKALNSSSSTNTKHIVSQFPPFIYVYNDGSIERPTNFPRTPPSPQDPATGVSAKDILFSKFPYLSARLFLPKLTQSQKVPILLYFHGGAFCCESAFATHHNKYCNLLSSQANVIIVAIEHRKAPEHFLPTAYNDCWAGLCWVASHATQNPTFSDPWLINHADFNRIFIGGDSSGANIVHNVAMRAGFEALPGGVKVYGAYLNHPYFWGSKPFGSEPVIGFEESPPSLAWNFAYPNAVDGLDNPMINPLAPGAPSLATIGCSKMLVTVAGKDHLHFRDRAVLYYEAVKASGWKGEVELFEEEEEDHVYFMYDLETEQAKRLVKILADFLRQ